MLRSTFFEPVINRKPAMAITLNDIRYLTWCLVTMKLRVLVVLYMAINYTSIIHKRPLSCQWQHFKSSMRFEIDVIQKPIVAKCHHFDQYAHTPRLSPDIN